MSIFSRNNSARALALAVALIAAQPALAQRSSTGFSGKVAATDTVSVRSVDTGLQREAKVEEDGRFSIRHLPVGTYEITIKHADGSEDKVVAEGRIGTTVRIR